MPRSTLVRFNNRAIFQRTSAEGGGGGNSGGGSGGENGQNSGGGNSGGENGGQNSGPAMATDEHGASLGFPKDTAVTEMTIEQQAKYWRNQSKVQQKRAEAAEREKQQNSQQSNEQGSGTVSNQQQQNGEKQTDQVDETAVRREAGKDAASATIRTALALRGKSAEEIDEIVDVIDSAKFLTADHKVDSAKVTAFITKTVPVRGGDGGNPGQGSQQQQSESRAAAGKAAAEKRWGQQTNSNNRGQYGGLRK